MAGEFRQSSRSLRTDLTPEEESDVTCILDVADRYKSRRWVFERDWYRNVLFYVGQQWIIYDEGARRWRLRNLPYWVPLPVTNRLASTVNVIRSSVAQVNPAFTAVPTQENEKSVLSANAADKYLDVIMNESGFRSAKRRLASWITLTGNGFLLLEFDTSPETGSQFIPGEKCLACETQIPPMQLSESLECPKCGSTELQEDPSIGVNVPQGRLVTRALSPFEVYVDNNIGEQDDQTSMLVIERRPLDAVKRTWKDAKNVDEIEGDTDTTTGQYFLNTLAFITGAGVGTGGIGTGGGGNAARETDAVTLYKLYTMTSEKYPDGSYLVMTGDQHILEKKEPYPFRYRKTNKPFYPIVHVRYDDVPGRFWAKTPVDDLTFKQKQRNEIESLYQTIIMRCANPVWLVPTGVTTSPISGEPGTILRYSSVGGLKPERMPGMDAPVTVIKFIEQIDQDFEEIANTFAVLKGKAPGSVRAASAIQMLIERGFGRYGSVFDNLEEAYEKWAVVALELWRQNAVYPRVQAVSKESGSWQFMEFLGSDIGEVDIRVEAGSTRPKSQAGRQLLVGQALQWGLMNPQDPEQRMKIFEELGMTHLLPGAQADIKVVAEENHMFLTWAQDAIKRFDEMGDQLPPDVGMMLLMQTFPLKGNPIIDHHPTHVVHHRRFALGEQFRSLPQVFQDLFTQHLMTAHLPFLLQEAMTGLGTTTLMGGMTQQAQGNPQQSTSKSGEPSTGEGPGGAVGPFGSKGSESNKPSPA